MIEADKANRIPLSVVSNFRVFLDRLRQNNPAIATRLENELRCHFGKPAIDQRLPLEVIVAWQIERRVSSRSENGELCNPEIYIALLFSPDPGTQEVDVRKFMRELIAV